MTKKEKRRLIYRYIFWGFCIGFMLVAIRALFVMTYTSDARVYDQQFWTGIASTIISIISFVGVLSTNEAEGKGNQ